MPENVQKPANKRLAAAAERRKKILEAAVTCFLEKGYHQTGVRDIAKQAGVSLGNLYNHFPGKHDVLVEIASLERAELEPFLKLLAKPSPAPDVLDKFMTRYAKYLAAPETVMLTIEITSEAIRKPDIGDLFLANRHELVTALAAVLKKGVAAGDFRASLDPQETSKIIIELLDAGAYRSVLTEISMQKVLRGIKSFIFTAVR